MFVVCDNYWENLHCTCEELVTKFRWGCRAVIWRRLYTAVQCSRISVNHLSPTPTCFYIRLCSAFNWKTKEAATGFKMCLGNITVSWNVHCWKFYRVLLIWIWPFKICSIQHCFSFILGPKAASVSTSCDWLYLVQIKTKTNLFFLLKNILLMIHDAILHYIFI